MQKAIKAAQAAGKVKKGFLRNGTLN